MSQRKTDVEIDFTEAQVIDALRTAGWQIPVVNPPPKLDVQGARIVVKWSEQAQETPI